MAEKPPVLGAIVSNTEPAIAPGTEQLKGRHVTLERLKEADIPSLWSALGVHTDLWTYWPEGPYSDLGEFTNAMNEVLAEANLASYTIYQHGTAAGCIFLQPADLGSRVMEIGMMYGPSLQRTRDATEALYLLACLSFDKLDNRRLEWKTDRLNLASQRAAERYGLVYEGCLRQHRIYKGRNRDTFWYSMLDSEWPKCKRAFEAWLDDANFDEQGKQKRSLGDIRQSVANQS
jgi:RimJ/RimL family protein N-acetyltransferase